MARLLRYLLAILVAGCCFAPALAQVQEGNRVSAFENGASAVTEADSADRWYVEGEYLVWWLRNGRLPPLLTVGSFASGGRLDAPGTAVAYGNEKLDTSRHIGTRWRVGYWFDEAQTFGVEAGFFVVERNSRTFTLASDGDPLLGRPFINALTGRQEAEVVAGPVVGGVRSGAFNGFTKIEMFGEELNGVVTLFDEDALRVEFLAGAHFFQLRERLDLTASSKLLPEEAILFGVTDHYRLHNRFYGGQLGLRGEHHWGRWFLKWQGKVALGDNHQNIKTFGDRLVATPTTRAVQPHGLLILPSNRGEFENDRFDVVYDLGVNLGYEVTDYLRVSVGYSLIYWTNVIRPGDQIDLALNPNQILTGAPSTPARPAITFSDDFFWAQGVNVGVEFSW